MPRANPAEIITVVVDMTRYEEADKTYIRYGRRLVNLPVGAALTLLYDEEGSCRIPYFHVNPIYIRKAGSDKRQRVKSPHTVLQAGDTLILDP